MMHYYTFRIGDYLKNTAHLTNGEDLAYRRLIDYYYDKEAPITADIATISRRIRCHENDVENVLKEFFRINSDGNFTHLTIEAELRRYKNMKDAGKNGAKTRWKNNNKINNIDRGGIPTPLTPQCQPITNNQEPITNIPPIVPLKGERVKKSKLKPEWRPNEQHNQIARERGIDCNQAAEYFRDWATAGGKQYADWNACFRNALKGWLSDKIKPSANPIKHSTGYHDDLMAAAARVRDSFHG